MTLPTVIFLTQSTLTNSMIDSWRPWETLRERAIGPLPLTGFPALFGNGHMWTATLICPAVTENCLGSS